MRSNGKACIMPFGFLSVLLLRVAVFRSSGVTTADAFPFPIVMQRDIIRKRSRFVSARFAKNASSSSSSTQPKFFWEWSKRRRRQEAPKAFSSIQASWKRRRTLLGIIRPHRPLDRFSQQLFDDADTNGDGWITVSEAYEFLLQMYIIMNRHAPLAPPTRAKVEQLFYEYDNNRLDRGLNREEFTQLMQHFTHRALSRMMAHRWVTLVGAPLCTEGVLRFIKPLLLGRSDAVIHVSSLPMLPSFRLITVLRSILLVLFATTLADIVFSMVDWVLDMTTPDAPDLATTVLTPVADVVEKSKKKFQEVTCDDDDDNANDEKAEVDEPRERPTDDESTGIKKKDG